MFIEMVRTMSLCLAYFLGSRDGAVVRALASHQCGSESIPGLDAICGLSLLLVLFSAPRGFSLGTPVFPSLQKTTFPNSNSIRLFSGRIATLWRCHFKFPLLLFTLFQRIKRYFHQHCYGLFRNGFF